MNEKEGTSKEMIKMPSVQRLETKLSAAIEEARTKGQDLTSATRTRDAARESMGKANGHLTSVQQETEQKRKAFVEAEENHGLAQRELDKVKGGDPTILAKAAEAVATASREKEKAQHDYATAAKELETAQSAAKKANEALVPAEEAVKGAAAAKTLADKTVADLEDELDDAKAERRRVNFSRGLVMASILMLAIGLGVGGFLLSRGASQTGLTRADIDKAVASALAAQNTDQPAESLADCLAKVKKLQDEKALTEAEAKDWVATKCLDGQQPPQGEQKPKQPLGEQPTGTTKAIPKQGAEAQPAAAGTATATSSNTQTQRDQLTAESGSIVNQFNPDFKPEIKVEVNASGSANTEQVKAIKEVSQAIDRNTAVGVIRTIVDIAKRAQEAPGPPPNPKPPKQNVPGAPDIPYQHQPSVTGQPVTDAQCKAWGQHNGPAPLGFEVPGGGVNGDKSAYLRPSMTDPQDARGKLCIAVYQTRNFQGTLLTNGTRYKDPRGIDFIPCDPIKGGFNCPIPVGFNYVNFINERGWGKIDCPSGYMGEYYTVQSLAGGFSFTCEWDRERGVYKGGILVDP